MIPRQRNRIRLIHNPGSILIYQTDRQLMRPNLPKIECEMIKTMITDMTAQTQPDFVDIRTISS